MAYDSDNIFAKILRREIPAFIVYETEHCVAFMDVMPQADGHTLVLPRQAAENLFDIDAQSARELLPAVQTVANAIREAFSPAGIRVMQFNGAAAGQTVFHLHMHIVPAYADSDEKMHARKMADAKLLESHAERIRAAIKP